MPHNHQPQKEEIDCIAVGNACSIRANGDRWALRRIFEEERER